MAQRQRRAVRPRPPWLESLWPWRWPLAVGAVLAWAAALRFHRIGEASLWLDEAYSIDWASRDYAFILDIARNRDFHPPEYYLLLHNWMLAFGQSEAAARSLSAVAGVAAVGGMYLLGRELFSRRAGIAAALLLTVSAFELYYSQEARSYSLLLALSIFSMHAYWRLHADRTRWAVAYYVVATAALAYSHNSGLLVILAQVLHRGVTFAIEGSRLRSLSAMKGDLARWGLAFGGAGLLYLPWLGAFLGQFSRLNAGYWMPKPTFDTGAGVGPDFTIVGTFAHFTGPVAAAVLLWALVANGLARSRLGGFNHDRNPDDTGGLRYPAAKVLLLVAWLLCSLFIPFVQSSVSQPSFISRALIPALAPFLLLAGAGAGRLRSLPLQAGVVVALVALAAPGLADHYGHPGKEPWRDVAGFIEANSEPGTPVVINGWNVFLAYDYYAQRDDLPVVRTGDASPATVADVANRTRDSPDVWFVWSHGVDAKELPRFFDPISATHPGQQCLLFPASGRGLASNPIVVLHWGKPVPADPERACG